MPTFSYLLTETKKGIIVNSKSSAYKVCIAPIGFTGRRSALTPNFKSSYGVWLGLLVSFLPTVKSL